MKLQTKQTKDTISNEYTYGSGRETDKTSREDWRGSPRGSTDVVTAVITVSGFLN